MPPEGSNDRSQIELEAVLVRAHGHEQGARCQLGGLAVQENGRNCTTRRSGGQCSSTESRPYATKHDCVRNAPEVRLPTHPPGWQAATIRYLLSSIDRPMVDIFVWDLDQQRWMRKDMHQ
ncbi:hypothetical protein BV25DRAFT_1826049 [Artomyces pyxidatus]|uniref:Uncharacterized protein n=1 Tax=Artomyces pyxidatus TaxID=48021 RepID=A0ACB8SZX2_9AGAM|nr:hypothetical protein BV25DRAFT_1826049 [Artomyces pyxidatus]